VAGLLIRNADNPDFAIAAKYGLQMTFGTTVLTLRKFVDLYEAHLSGLIPPEGDARAAGEWILEECRTRNTRRAANLLFAHYAECTTDPPLCPEHVEALVHAGSWASEEAVVEWLGPVIDKLLLIQQAMDDGNTTRES